MQIKRYNVTVPENYQKDGEEKTYWNNVGTITEFHKEDGKVSRILKIPAIGLEASIFPAEPRENQGDNANRTPNTSKTQDSVDYPDEDINPEDIPF